MDGGSALRQRPRTVGAVRPRMSPQVGYRRGQCAQNISITYIRYRTRRGYYRRILYTYCCCVRGYRSAFVRCRILQRLAVVGIAKDHRRIDYHAVQRPGRAGGRSTAPIYYRSCRVERCAARGARRRSQRRAKARRCFHRYRYR